MHIYCTIIYRMLTTYDKVLREDGAIMAETCRAVLIIIRVFYCLCAFCSYIKLLNPTGHVMHQQFNIQQLYVLPTLYLCVLYLSENKQRLVPLTA